MYPYEYDFSPGPISDGEVNEEDIFPPDDDFSSELYQCFFGNLKKESSNEQTLEHQTQKHFSSLLQRIHDEMNFSDEKFVEFNKKLKKAMKTEKEDYVVPVKQVRRIDNVQRCTVCSRRILSFSKHALEFKVAFYHFTFGRTFDKQYLKKLHNNICENIHIRKISRDESRSIKLYFANFWNSGFEIIREAHKYLEEHPEFVKEIRDSIQAKKS